MRMHPVTTLEAALDAVGRYESAFVMPHGARVLPRLSVSAKSS